MREAAGLVAANALFVFAGTGVLAGLGVLRPRGADWARATGLSLILGMSIVVMAGIALLVVGIPVRFLTLAVVAFVAGVAGLAVARRQGRWPQLTLSRPRLPRLTASLVRRPELPAYVALIVALVALAVFFAIAYTYYKVSPAAQFDDFSIWSKKALALFYLDDLKPRFFTNSAYLPIHQEYPLFLPLLEAFTFRAMGTPDTRLVHIEFLVLFVSFIGALAYMVHRESRHFLWVPFVIALAVAPFIHQQLVTGYADIPMSCFVGLGVLALGLWLERGESWRLALAVVFFAAAGNTKFEGLIAASLAFVAAVGVIAVQRRWRSLVPAGVAVASFVALLLPWRLWVAAHPEIQSFFHPGRGFSIDYLSDHSDLPGDAIDLIAANIADPGQSFYIVPIALALVVFSIVTRRARPVAAFYLAVSLLLLAALVWVYWVDPTTWSPNRVVDSVILIAAMAILHLTSQIPVSAGASASAEPPRGTDRTEAPAGTRASPAA